jgi:hypothetical protein
MARNKKGWLTAESLLAGEREQYAVDRSYGRVIIEILPNRNPKVPDELFMPWFVSVAIVKGEDVEYTAYQCFRLDAARRKFTQLQRQHP